MSSLALGGLWADPPHRGVRVRRGVREAEAVIEALGVARVQVDGVGAADEWVVEEHADEGLAEAAAAP